MPSTLPFFVASLSDSINKSFAAIPADRKLESDERLINTDVVCEGPIEGLVDKQGNLLKYITDSNTNAVESIILGKGVYYNDVPLVDDKLNKLNFVTQGFDMRYGEEFNNYTQQYASTVHRYNKKIYLNELDYKTTLGLNDSSGLIAIQKIDNKESRMGKSYGAVIEGNATPP